MKFYDHTRFFMSILIKTIPKLGTAAKENAKKIEL